MNVILMHKNIEVLNMTIDEESGTINKIYKNNINDLYVPVYAKRNIEDLKEWWMERAVPIKQETIKRLLSIKGITPYKLLFYNWGLSLTDTYWIKPLNSNLSWDDINLYTNQFDDNYIEKSIDNYKNVDCPYFSPAASLKGEMWKKWIIDNDNKRRLIKCSIDYSKQQCVNEVIATLLHKKQGFNNYVKYELIDISIDEKHQIGCICDSFTSEEIEFVSANEILNSEKKRNELSYYQHFVNVCEKNGINYEDVIKFMNYQILSDYILTNTDRHMNNFGLLRNTNTMEYIGFAPIFDTGNSMFWNNKYVDVNDIEINSFKTSEGKMLKYVTDYDCIDIKKIPNVSEIGELLSKVIQDPYEVKRTIHLYSKKIELLS